MYLMSFYIDSRQRAYRAEVLASAASDADCRVDSRDFQRVLVVRVILRVERHHCYRPCRTVACAVSAVNAFADRQAVLANPYGMAYLYG